MQHNFDIQEAINYGLNEAIFLSNMKFWIAKNIANEKNYFPVCSEKYPDMQNEYRYWTYNTVQAYTKLFPYWTDKQVRNIIDSLLKQSIIIKGYYHENKCNRTSWYAFKKELQMPEKANGNDKKDKCIYTDNKHTDRKQTDKKENTQSKNFANSPSSFEVVSFADNNIQMQKEQHDQLEVKIKINAKEKTNPGGGEFETFCAAYPNKLGKSKSETKFAAACKKIGFDNLMRCIENYKTHVDTERKNGFPNLAFMHLSTFINGRYEDFLVNEKQVQIDNSPKYKGISLATQVNMKISGGAQSKLDLGFVLRLAIRTPQNIHNITYNGLPIAANELEAIKSLLAGTKYEN